MAPSNLQSNDVRVLKTTWLKIFSALVGSVFVYLLLGWLQAKHRPGGMPAPPMGLRLILGAVALACLVASAAYLNARTSALPGTNPGGAAPEPLAASKFQTDSIVALALAEACTVIGLLLFFLGAPLVQMVPFAAGTLVVDVGLILPRGLAFWQALQQQCSAPSGPFS